MDRSDKIIRTIYKEILADEDSNNTSDEIFVARFILRNLTVYRYNLLYIDEIKKCPLTECINVVTNNITRLFLYSLLLLVYFTY